MNGRSALRGATVYLIVLITSNDSAGAIGTEIEGRSLEAERLEPGERVAIDGHFDEAAWSRASVASGFRQHEPREGEAASQRTEVRVLFDADTLYVGAMMYDQEPAQILSFARARDAGLQSDDVFSFVLDTFGDGRTGYLFETNPAGLLADALLGDNGTNNSWDGVWDVRTTQTAQGWQAEFAVPFRTLNFDPQRATWSINFRRVLRRANEDSLWSAHLRTQGLTRTLYAGRLTGLAGMSQGRGLEFKPYVASRRTSLSGRPTENDTDAGFDFTYSITANLRAALTVNTDFADTEVDERQLNLGRFPIRFPEKRDFFLEGSAVFSFPSDGNITPFYSRRIGLAREGPVPIAWGGRLAGQVGWLDLGALQIRTRSAFGREAEDFTVLRTRANVAEDSYAGFLYTRRGGHEPRDRHTLGFDANWRVANFGDGRTVSLQPYLIWTNRAAGDESSDWRDRSVLGLDAEGRWSRGNASIGWQETGEAYDPAVGFAFDRGYRALEARIDFEHQPRLAGVQEVRHYADYERRSTLSGALIESSFDIGVVDVEFESGDSIDLMVDWDAELYDEEFEIWDDIVVPPGRYEGPGWRLGMRTAEKRPWSAELELTGSEFLTGRRHGYEAQFEVRPVPGLSASIEAELEKIDLAEGDFTTRVWSARLGWSFTTRHTLNLLGQYDNDSDVIGLQFRFRWIVRPGTEVFVGYLHDWEREDEGSLASGESRHWRTLGRQSAFKGTYTWWF